MGSWPTSTVLNQVAAILNGSWARHAGPAHLRALPPAPAVHSAERPRVGVIDLAFTPDLPALVAVPVHRERFVRATLPPAAARHGTAIAATVALGAPCHTLHLAAVGTTDALAPPRAVAEALRWMAAEEVHVIALPLGDPDPDDDLALAIADILLRPRPPAIFASLGNDHPDPGLFPARHPGVTAVAAADPDGRLLADACRAPPPDLIAPGAGLTAPFGHGRHGPLPGSSLACAVAAGAAARWIAVQPDLAGDRRALLAALRAAPVSTGPTLPRIDPSPTKGIEP